MGPESSGLLLKKLRQGLLFPPRLALSVRTRLTEGEKSLGPQMVPPQMVLAGTKAIEPSEAEGAKSTIVAKWQSMGARSRPSGSCASQTRHVCDIRAYKNLLNSSWHTKPPVQLAALAAHEVT